MQSETKCDVILFSRNIARNIIPVNEGLKWIVKILQVDPEAWGIKITAYCKTGVIVEVIKWN